MKRKTFQKEFLLADSTGAIRSVVWEKDVGVETVGCSYKLENVTVRSFGGVKYVSLSENATIHEIDDIGEVLEDNVPAMKGRIVNGEIVHVEKGEK